MYVVDLHSRMKLCQINLFFHFLFFLLLPFKLFLLYDLDLAAAAAERWHPGMYPRVFSSRGPPPRRLGFVASSRQSSSRAPFPRREIFSPFLRGLLSVVKTFFLVSFLFFRVLFITLLDFFWCAWGCRFKFMRQYLWASPTAGLYPIRVDNVGIFFMFGSTVCWYGRLIAV